MTRLSKPASEIQSDYTVVVVGSGYGGGIAASRLARAGQSVCVLERGREFIAGEFPDTLLEFEHEAQARLPHETVGNPNGLYEFQVDEAISVFHGCGLGGTSLVNANVALKADPRVFDSDVWPAEVRADLDTLVADGYKRAEEMLRPNPYPDGFAKLQKLETMEKSARDMGEKFYRTPINVNFEDFSKGNHVGVPQAPCVLCGDCVSGCNHTSKNTVAMNYLPDAVNHGAEVFCQVSVRHLEKDGKRWRVYYTLEHSGREKFSSAPELFVTADVVVLGAGCLGSTEILLRSASHRLELSNQLGLHFSGNGDALGFAYNADEPVNALGMGARDPEDCEPVGPCITGIIDMRDTPKLEDGMVLEEGVVPGALAAIQPGALATAAKLVGKDTDSGVRDKLGEEARELDSAVRGPHHGAVHNTQTYLAMAHDGADGRMRLENDRLRIEWPGVGDKPIFQKIAERMRQATSALGGTFVRNPIWSRLTKSSLVTVHPLGGAVMGSDAGKGVVNHKGQVFAGTAGEDVHEGLYVADGAILPTSVGVNPLFTISAMAERICYLLAKDHGWSLDYALPSKARAETVPSPTTVGVEFTETMRGYFSTGEKEDFEAGYKEGERAKSPFTFVLTIATDDVDEIVSNPEHEARMVGSVEAPELSKTPLLASNGIFNLFKDNPDQIDTTNMIYRMELTGDGGKHFFFHGYKVVRADKQLTALEVWPDTSTLYITIYEGSDETGAVVGKGILHIEPQDFARQLTTMKALNAPNKMAALKAISKFGGFFARDLWQTYGGVVSPTEVFAEKKHRKRRPLRTGAPEVVPFTTVDGIALRLTRYQGGKKGPVILAPGFSNTASVYALDTTETSFVEYLVANDYDVWLFDRRSSPALPAARTKYTFDDIAKYDWPAAVERTRELTDAESVQVVAHCMGSMTFLMSVMAGHLQGVRSAALSQVTTYFETSWDNELKALARTDSVLATLGKKTVTTHVKPDWKSAGLDKLLKLYPRPASEHCDYPVCHKIWGIFGPVYRHQNLNRATHYAMDEIFGVAATHVIQHMTRIFRAGHAVDHDGKDVYMPHLDRLGFPIHFIAGMANEMCKPSSSKKLYDELRARFGDEYHTRTTFDDYAHMDCFIGVNSARDIFPDLVTQLDRHN